MTDEERTIAFADLSGFTALTEAHGDEIGTTIEFSALRWQRFAEEQSANELLFQVLFVIGAHGAHAF